MENNKIRIVCIKYSDSFFEWNSKKVIRNKIYVEIFPNHNILEYLNKRNLSFICDENGKYISYFDSGCFMSLAEFREQRINSILE